MADSMLGHVVQIVYNKEYGRYVLLFHADTPTFSYPSVGVAYSTEITGRQTWNLSFVLGSGVWQLSGWLCRAIDACDSSGCISGGGSPSSMLLLN